VGLFADTCAETTGQDNYFHRFTILPPRDNTWCAWAASYTLGHEVQVRVWDACNWKTSITVQAIVELTRGIPRW
jgi:hypothetical protein